MSVFAGILTYMLIWCVVIFCALPFGVKNIEEPTDGTMPGAPVHHGLKKKIIFTTIISTVIWVIVYLIIVYGGLSFHDRAMQMSL